MRNLKKVLSLVLCVAVMLSVMVLGAGAAFSDQDQIENTEAVEMATALKIISGYEDGSYHPERNIKRSEMCKMICIALNGGKEPATATKPTPTFSDIGGHWAEGYIEYCYAQGVVSGVGDGRFNPDGNVTVTQAAKMLLVALGYNANVEQFNGGNWSLYVNVKANQDGIYKDLESIDTAAALNRDQAAQMVWNTMQAKSIVKTSSIDITDGSVVEHYEKGKTTMLADKYDATIYEGKLRASGSMAPYGVAAGKDKLNVLADYIDGELVLSSGSPVPSSNTLKCATDYTDLLGEYVKVVYSNKDKTTLGVFSVEEENTVVINTTIGALDDIGSPANTLTVDDTTYDVDAGANARYYNGTAWADVAIMNLGSDTAFNNYDNVKLIDNDGDEKIDTAIVIDNQIEKVTYVGSDRVTLTNKGEVKSADAVYSDLAVDDYVSYVSGVNTFDGKAVLTKTETMSGEVTEVGKNSSNLVDKVKVDGEWYTLAQTNGSAPIKDTDSNALEYKNTYDFNLYNGYIVNAAKVKGSNYKVAVVTGLTGATDYDGNQQARLLLADGTTVEAYVDDLGGNGFAEGDLISYTVEGNVYKAYDTAAGTSGNYEPAAGFDHYDSGTGDNNRFDATNKWVVGTTKTEMKVNNDAVVFVQYDKDGADAGETMAFKVITGTELNSWKSNFGDTVEFLYNDSGLGFADVVYITGGTGDILPGIRSNYGYITSNVTEGSDANGVYSTFTMWDGTEEQTVIVRKSIDTLGAAKGSAISYDWNAENELTNVATIGTVGALTYSNDGQVKIGATGYELADDVTIINVSTKDQAKVEGNAIAYAAQTDIEGIYYNNCWYVYDKADKEIDLLIIDVTSNKLVGTGAGTVIVGNSLSVDDIKNAPDGVYYPTSISSLPVNANQHDVANMMVFKFTGDNSASYTLNIGTDTTSNKAVTYVETANLRADTAGHFFYVDITGAYNTAGTSGTLYGNGTTGTALSTGVTYYWEITSSNGTIASGSFVIPAP